MGSRRNDGLGSSVGLAKFNRKPSCLATDFRCERTRADWSRLRVPRPFFFLFPAFMASLYNVLTICFLSVIGSKIHLGRCDASFSSVRSSIGSKSLLASGATFRSRQVAGITRRCKVNVSSPQRQGCSMPMWAALTSRSSGVSYDQLWTRHQILSRDREPGRCRL
jgi:hypothetical protein